MNPFNSLWLPTDTAEGVPTARFLALVVRHQARDDRACTIPDDLAESVGQRHDNAIEILKLSNDRASPWCTVLPKECLDALRRLLSRRYLGFEARIEILEMGEVLRNLTRPRLLSKSPRYLDRRSGSTKANTIAASTDIVCVSAELNIPSVLVAAGPPRPLAMPPEALTAPGQDPR